MAITLDTATQLETLALSIFNANIDPTTNKLDPTRFTGLKAQDSPTDAQYLALIAPVMLEIDGRTMAPGFEYTLNVTCALEGRAKHWFLQGVEEFCETPAWQGWSCNTALAFYPDPGGAVAGVGSYGWTIGLATCAAVLLSWASIIRLWLAGNYPLAVNQPSAA